MEMIKDIDINLKLKKAFAYRLAFAQHKEIDPDFDDCYKFGFSLIKENNPALAWQIRELAFDTIPMVTDSMLTSNSPHCYGWGYSSWFYANPDKQIGVLVKTGSKMFPVKVKGTADDVKLYFTPAKEVYLRRLANLRVRVEAKTVELHKYITRGVGLSLDGLPCNPNIDNIRSKIKRAITTPKYNEDIDCLDIVTCQTNQVISRYDKNLKIRKWLLPAHALRHIKKSHPDLFERVDAINDLLSVVSDPVCVNQAISVPGWSLALEKNFGSSRIVIVFLISGDYDDKLKLKTGYLKGLGVHDAENRPAGYVRNVLPDTLCAKLDNIFII